MSEAQSPTANSGDRDVEKWGCGDCMRILEDGPYDTCPDCDSENVKAWRKFVVVTASTIEVPAEDLNLTYAANQARGNADRIVAIYDKDTGEQIYDAETDSTDPFHHPLDEDGSEANTDAEEDKPEAGSDPAPTGSADAGLLERLSALGKALISGRFTHELRTTVRAKPTSMTDDEHVFVTLYKERYVLHYDEHGEDRTTTLSLRELTSTLVDIDDMSSRGIPAPVAPLDWDEWAAEHDGVDKTGGLADGD